MCSPRLLSVLFASAITAVTGADELSFNRDIRPILSDACFFCHGPDPTHREADLRLDVEEDAKDSAIVPGEVDASEVIARIMSDDADMLMPPPESGKKLTPEQIVLLKKWVEKGARYEPYWAYSDPIAPDVPAADLASWPRDPIDHFTLEAMRSAGLSPSSDADPATLLRRVCFDLTGLPPTPQLLDSYLSNPTPARFAAIVDQLLACSEFGERMAVYWLDLVRYADTVGYHGDQDHNASPYRDYVIDAFNRDMPLDQFTREQLAGDLLPEPTTDQLTASGYNRLLQTSHEGGVQPKEYLAIYAADRVRNVSAVWMGATVGCAQCHDHKYDPYTSEDFYSLAAFFADLDESQHFKVGSNALPTKRPPEISVLSRWQRDWLAATQESIDAIETRLVESEDPADRLREQLAELTAVRDQILAWKRMVMISKSIEPREIRLLPRGDWLDDSGPVVQPMVPHFLKSPAVDDARATRLELANWLTDQNRGVGGMTARVFVNRFWYLTFGRGISSSLADFGGQGQPPTHPELLDYLALDFVQGGWSVKRMMRRLVLTRSYQQSSVASADSLTKDPYNQWFARQSRYRLPAEMVRDNALAASGLLVRQVGGESVKPYQPAGYYRHLNFPTRLYVPHTDARQWRRGVYVHWQRQFLHPMLKSMDAPSREECTSQRDRSNTPLEALVLLNDPTMVESAVAMAWGLIRDGDRSTDSQRLQRAFRLATSRGPDPQELRLLAEMLDKERTHYESSPGDAEALLESVDAIGGFPAKDTVSLAAWTGVCRAILNMYETVTRN
jgi:hypothetical protein